jgi:hypothetical protein
MAGPCGIPEQQWPYAANIDTCSGLRWDPVLQRLWAAPPIIVDGVDVVFANEFPAGGNVGLLQVSPTRTVRLDNPSDCLPMIAFITHRYGIQIENDLESQVNITQFASFGVGAPAPAPVIGETFTAGLLLSGALGAGYETLEQSDWFSPVVVPPSSFVEVAHFMVVSQLRVDVPFTLPRWGVGCSSAIKIWGLGTQS